MDIRQNVSLADYSTMRLGGVASYLLEVTDRNQIPQAVIWAEGQKLPVLMIGTGSNIVWGDNGFKGLVLVNKILSYEPYEEDETNTYITIGGGEPWDSVVSRTVDAGLTGIEALSLIPGSTGATPIQNVGAYGQDISQTLTTIEAFDITTKAFVTIPISDCAFSYRSSRFKTTDKGRFFIISITLHLLKSNPMPPFYASVQSYFEQNNISDYTSQALRDAVIAIRNSKLPDPRIVNNCGSFFANPIVSNESYNKISELNSMVPHWDTENDMVKISGAWLIEQAGFKDFHDQDSGMATWPKQPLVLVNESATNTAALLSFKSKIVDAVRDKFGITLEQEPEFIES